MSRLDVTEKIIATKVPPVQDLLMRHWLVACRQVEPPNKKAGSGTQCHGRPDAG